MSRLAWLSTVVASFNNGFQHSLALNAKGNLMDLKSQELFHGFLTFPLYSFCVLFFVCFFVGFHFLLPLFCQITYFLTVRLSFLSQYKPQNVQTEHHVLTSNGCHLESEVQGKGCSIWTSSERDCPMENACEIQLPVQIKSNWLEFANWYTETDALNHYAHNDLIQGDAKKHKYWCGTLFALSFLFMITKVTQDILWNIQLQTMQLNFWTD